MSGQDGWEHILNDGEEILWQGRPDAAVVWSDLFGLQSIFGLFFAGFAAFWIKMASFIGSGIDDGGIGDIFPLFGIPFLLVGLYMVIGHVFFDAYQRGRTHYTLTNQNAYIATQMFGRRKLENYPHKADTTVELEDNTPGTVWFATKLVRHVRNRSDNGNHMSSQRVTYSEKPIGFCRIEDARKVYGMLRKIVADLKQSA